MSSYISHIMLLNDTICVCYTVIMPSDNGPHDKVQPNLRPQRGLQIVRSVAGDETWHALWDWLLAPESPTEPTDKESETVDEDN